MDTQVKLVLTALNGNVAPAERTIALSPDYDTIPVGRASKSLSKGLQGAVDNAWFDSPVMSRHHAEIILNPEPKTVTIQDVGSMHGTLLNSLPLTIQKPMTISNGDVLTFGAEVKRGSETFPACSFRVNYEFIPYNRGSSTYAFPDTSDIEDDEEDEYSDLEIMGRQQPSSVDGISIESPPPKFSQPIQAIDLTREDVVPTSPKVHSIDLTGETAMESQWAEAEPTPAQSTNITPTQTAVQTRWVEPTPVPSSNIGLPRVASYSYPIIVDTDEEDSDSASDEESEDADFDDSGSSSSGELDIDEVGSVELNIDEVDANGNINSIFEAPAPDRRRDDPLFNNATASREGLSRIRLSHIRTQISDPQDATDEREDDEEEEDESSQSDISLSEAGAEGIRALFESSPEEHTKESNPFGRDYEAPENQQTPQEIPPTQSFIEKVSEPTEESNIDELSRSPALHLTTAPLTPFRQPSPSDAAMVKSSISSSISPNEVLAKGFVTFDKAGAEALGQKSGKEAFFAAREANKVAVHRNMAVADWGNPSIFDYDPSLSNPTDLFVGNLSYNVDDERLRDEFQGFGEISGARVVTDTATGASKGFGYVQFTNSASAAAALTAKRASHIDGRAAVVDFSGPYSESTGLAGASLPPRARKGTLAIARFAPINLSGPSKETIMPTRDACSFLDNPQSLPIETRIPSPLPDMTSAANYNTSKELMTASQPRSRVSIDDIIESSSTQPEPTNLKRKADEISDAIELELRTRGNSSSPDIVQDAIPKELPNPTLLQPYATDAHPAKRFKKILENVGYAALGGVAVGAGLFSVLVATAPDFV